MIFKESNRMNVNRNSSKGNQLKWVEEQYWYKADNLGYEALSEYVISQLLGKTTVLKYAEYELEKMIYEGNTFMGCKSKSFMEPGDTIITLSKLFQSYKNENISVKCAHMENVKDRIAYVVDTVVEITGLVDFGKYLTMLLEMDAFFLNDDRHFNNIAVLYNDETKAFGYCPVFDNGSALFSDTTLDFPMDMDYERCLEKIQAKPFDRSFDEQIEAAEALYGIQFYYWFDRKEVEKILKGAGEYYGLEVVERVYGILSEQIRIYGCFRRKTAEPPREYQ